MKAAPGRPARIRAIEDAVAEEYLVSLDAVLGDGMNYTDHVAARWEIWRRILDLPAVTGRPISISQIGRWYGTGSYAIAYARKQGWVPHRLSNA